MTRSRDISWDFYRTFLSVLSDGSLSAAARELGTRVHELFEQTLK